MAKAGENELKAQLKSKALKNVYMLYGEEAYLKQHYVSRLKKAALSGGMEDFNYHQYEGKNASMDSILMDAQMLPMMSEYTFVLVHDYPFEKSSEDVKKLKEFFKDIPESCVLVFWFDSIDVNPKQASKWNTIIKLFADAGDAVELQKRSEGDLVKLITAAAQKKKCTISPYCAKYFIGLVGSDLQTLLNELEKICSFVGEGEITKEIIDDLAVKSLQARVYDLSKFILKGDSSGAYEVLRALFAQREEPIGILAIIASYYVDMYRTKCAKAADVPINDLSSYFSYKGREFVLRNASRDSASIGTRKLRQSLDVLADCDSKMKSTSINSQILLEETVAKLLMIRQER